MRSRPPFLLPVLIAALSAAAAASGCRCGPEDSDGGADGSSNLLATNSVVHVISAVTGIEQLHVTARPLDLPNMGGTCGYTGETYEGYVPEITVGEIDLSTATTFHIRWTGSTDAVTDLGGFAPSGVGQINCLIDIEIEALGAGGAVLATGGSPNTVFAFYGTTDGPRDVPIDLQ